MRVISIALGKVCLSSSDLKRYFIQECIPVQFFRNAQECQYWQQRLYYVKTKKNPMKNVTPSGNRIGPLITSDSKSNTILSGLTGHVLLRRSLNFCS